MLRPELLDPREEADRDRFEALRRSGCSVLDSTPLQLEDLADSRRPGLGREELEGAVRELAEEIGPRLVWVHYPWQRALVRALPAAEFVEVRSSRNRYKITPSEQGRLRRATIGVVGLSVGHSAAVNLALEGVGGHFRLADFDVISLSNTNRVPCRLSDVGVNKAVLAARRLYEIDPYLQVEIFAEGIRDRDIEPFFGGERPLDLLVEECDGLEMKVRLREEARRRRIPVVMDTNDRGLLDIERFDLEPERPIFHGLVPGIASETLRGLSTRDKVPFVLQLLQAERISPRLAASLLEIDETISGLPQLATGTSLGGALVADASRRILLDERVVSGRFYVDLRELTAPGAAATIPPVMQPPPRPAEEPLVAAPATAVRRGGRPGKDEILYLVERAILAPSGGNVQPWRFRWDGAAGIDCGLDPARSRSFLDFEQGAAAAAVGAAAENLVLAAGELGLAAEVELGDDPEALVRVHLERTGASASRLAALVPERMTNRRLVPRTPLRAAERRALEATVDGEEAVLHVLEDAGALAELGELLGELDRLRFFDVRLYEEMMSELAWPRDGEVASLGIDVDTLELDAAGRAGLQMLRNRPIIDEIRSLGIGRALGKSSREAVDAASAVAILQVSGTSQRHHARGGRILEQMWLTATGCGLGTHPMTAGLYMFARLERGAGAGFDPELRDQLFRLRERYAALVPCAPGWAEIALVRFVRAPKPSRRSRRLPASEVLRIDD